MSYFSKRRSTSHEVKTFTQDDFFEWLKPRLKEMIFESVYENKEAFAHYVHDLVMYEWRHEYQMFLLNNRHSMLIKSYPVLCSNVVEFLLKEKKINFKTKIPSL